MTPVCAVSARQKFYHAQLHLGQFGWGDRKRGEVLDFGLVAQRYGQTFPLGTLAVNVTGSFVIGAFAALTDPDGRLLASPSLRDFFMIGICGGYTTFSSFSLQTLTLAQEGEWLRAVLNSVASFALCLLAVWIGHFAVSLLNKS